MNSRAATLAIVLMLVLSGCASLAPPVDRGSQSSDKIGAVESPEDFGDPQQDRLGWEGGYWYDEPLEVTTEDGLSEREQAAIVNRTMARIEYVRGLEFKEPVTVEVVSREQFRRQRANHSLPEPRRHQLNVTYEALFMINSTTDATTVLNRNAGSSVGGYYSATQNRIVVIGDGPEALLLNERTLGHELLHALQDQQFDLTRYDRRTIDRNNAISGLVEGDARFVEHHYRQYCQQEWNCLAADGGERSSSQLANIGPYLLTYQPYSDGPTFVRQHYRRGGWSSVNQLYGDPPTTTAQTVHPNRYPDKQPLRPRVRDRTRGSWDRIEVENRPNHVELGEAGANAMLVYPSYESGRQTEVIPLQHFINTRNGATDQFDPLNYDHRYTDGIRGDRLVPYRNDAGETGYVWAFAFESTADAREFREGYTQLLRYRNAEPVDASGPDTTYRIAGDDANGFGAAIRIVHSEERLVITSAPTVRQLNDVRNPPKQPISQSRGLAEPTANPVPIDHASIVVESSVDRPAARVDEPIAGSTARVQQPRNPANRPSSMQVGTGQTQVEPAAAASARGSK